MWLMGALAGAVAYKFGVRGETAKNRILSFINSTELPFQAKHARIAVATGGILGKGPGNSDQRNILPHPYSDFVYAILIEEYGMIGGIVVVILYLILLHRGMKAAYNSERAFGGLLSAGLSFDLVCQAMVNMGVVVGLGPITGQPLPLISMGGTAMVFTGISVERVRQSRQLLRHFIMLALKFLSPVLASTSIIEVFERCDSVDKVIVVGLAIFSLIAWTVMFGKYFELKRLRLLNHNFDAHLRDQRSLLDLPESFRNKRVIPYADLFADAFESYWRAAAIAT